LSLLAFALGPILALLMLVIGPPEASGMSVPAWRTAAVGIWMGLWWVTEAVPIAATALLPLVLLPLLGILAMNAAAAPYANPVIFLFFGGFILAAAFEKSGLHRRLALALLGAVGTRPDRIVLGFMIAGAFMSMWVSNTATVLMLLPLANSMMRRPDEDGERAASVGTDFERALLLGIAYAATIGGFGTLVGTPPNALLSGFLQQTHGVKLGFLDFMLVGVPIVVVATPLTWLVLTRVVFKLRAREAIAESDALARQRQQLGPASRNEKFVAGVAILTAAAWIGQPWLAGPIPGLTEAGISVACATALFVIPIDRQWTRVVDWKAAEEIPWGVLVLFGGGLSLAAAIQGSGLAQWIGDSVGGLRSVAPLLLIFIVVTVITFLTEFTSNTATAAAFLPIASSLAVGAGMNPLVLAVAAGLAASNGFMLPVGTPPNAIVFASGKLSIPQMARAGFLIDLIFIVLITAVSYLLVLPILG
jgi:sodium-dependent dicarboxylate transporter 2/3/5